MPPADRKQIAHIVFFTLHEPTDERREELVASCHEHLTGHPGTVYFSAGVREPELDRPVNDDQFDVALHVVFESREAHDAYQQAARHLAFIEANKANWKQVRVFDSRV